MSHGTRAVSVLGEAGLALLTSCALSEFASWGGWGLQSGDQLAQTLSAMSVCWPCSAGTTHRLL